MNLETNLVVASQVGFESINMILIEPQSNVCLESDTMNWAVVILLQALEVVENFVSLPFLYTEGRHVVEVVIVELSILVGFMRPCESLANEVRNCRTPWRVSDDFSRIITISDSGADDIPSIDRIFIFGYNFVDVTLKEWLHLGRVLVIPDEFWVVKRLRIGLNENMASHGDIVLSCIVSYVIATCVIPWP